MGRRAEIERLAIKRAGFRPATATRLRTWPDEICGQPSASVGISSDAKWQAASALRGPALFSSRRSSCSQKIIERIPTSNSSTNRTRAPRKCRTNPNKMQASKYARLMTLVVIHRLSWIDCGSFSDARLPAPKKNLRVLKPTTTEAHNRDRQLKHRTHGVMSIGRNRDHDINEQERRDDPCELKDTHQQRQ